MTLDREERERREDELDDPGLLWGYLKEAHARIEDLEEALHASRLRREELDHRGRCAYGAYKAEAKRAEGYRKAAIILRDLYRSENTFIVPRRG